MSSSPFNLDHQNGSIDSKIVVALERISTAFKTLLWEEAKKNKLSPVQIQMLIFILFHAKEKCKVGQLSKEFNLTKATISDSVKSLLQKKLIEKIKDTIDTRSYSIALTESGKDIAQKASSFASSLEEPVTQLSEAQKENTFSVLTQLIHQLNQSGVITVQRMCLSCVNYSETNGKQYCSLLKANLKSTDLRIDCPDYTLSE